jgi:hypothetical protein
MSVQPAVAKTTWTDADFDTMGWHDNAVHAVALEPAPSDPGRLLLDIDHFTIGLGVVSLTGDRGRSARRPG